MKHGDQAKAKSAKAKASAEKGSATVAPGKGGKVAVTSQERKSESGGQAPGKGSPSKKGSGKERAGTKESAAIDRAKTRPAPAPEPIGFANPIVGAAYKRALKKYGTALRRLTE